MRPLPKATRLAFSYEKWSRHSPMATCASAKCDIRSSKTTSGVKDNDDLIAALRGQKKPDIKWIRTEDEIKEIIKTQTEILFTSSKYVKKGGKLVYSTCTINENENYKVVEKLLEKGDFELINQKTILPSQSGDGFYICSLRRK